MIIKNILSPSCQLLTCTFIKKNFTTKKDSSSQNHTNNKNCRTGTVVPGEQTISNKKTILFKNIKILLQGYGLICYLKVFKTSGLFEWRSDGIFEKLD